VIKLRKFKFSKTEQNKKKRRKQEETPERYKIYIVEKVSAVNLLHPQHNGGKAVYGKDKVEIRGNKLALISESDDAEKNNMYATLIKTNKGSEICILQVRASRHKEIKASALSIRHLFSYFIEHGDSGLIGKSFQVELTGDRQKYLVEPIPDFLNTDDIQLTNRYKGEKEADKVSSTHCLFKSDSKEPEVNYQITDEASRDAFRKKYQDANLIYKSLKDTSIMVLDWITGLGKGEAIKNLINSGLYEGVVYLTSQHIILDDIKSKISKELQDKVYVFKGRPRSRCEENDRNKEWLEYEKKNMTQLGWGRVCMGCPAKGDEQNKCPYPYSIRKPDEDFKGKTIFLATVDHLKNNPNFIDELLEFTGENTVTVLDEAKIATFDYAKFISFDAINSLKGILIQAKNSEYMLNSNTWSKKIKPSIDSLLGTIETLLKREPVKSAPLNTSGTLKNFIQQQLYDNSYFQNVVNVAPMLQHIHNCRHEYDDSGIHFRMVPSLPTPTIFAAANAPVEMLKNIIQPNYPFFSSEFKREVSHYPESGAVKSKFKGTEFYVVNNTLGSVLNFKKRENRRTIYKFILTFCWHNRKKGEGERTALTAKIGSKQFDNSFKAFPLSKVIEELNEESEKYKLGFVFGLGDKFTDEELEDKNVVPFINYGKEGQNRYKDFENIATVNNFNQNHENLIECCTKNLLPSEKKGLDFHVDYQNRKVLTLGYTAKNNDVIEKFSAEVLEQLENNTIDQALGRIRFNTNIRCVIAQIRNSSDTFPVTKEFDSHKELAKYLGLPEFVDICIESLRNAGVTPEEMTGEPNNLPKYKVDEQFPKLKKYSLAEQEEMIKESIYENPEKKDSEIAEMLVPILGRKKGTIKNKICTFKKQGVLK
jgi:hypothetical protein